MDGEVWLDVVDLAAAAGISKQAIHKRLGSFVTRKVKGLGHAGHRHQLLLSSLPEAWQAAYWRRVNALPLPWQDAVLTKALPAPEPEPPLALPVPIPPPVPVAHAGAGSLAPFPHGGAGALSSPVPAADATPYIKEWQRACLHARLALLQDLDRLILAHGVGRGMDTLIAAVRAEQLPPERQALVPVALGRADAGLSRPTLARWLMARDRGLDHLAPRPKARGPRVPPWAPYLLKEWQRPQKPSLAFALEQLAAPGALPAGLQPPSASAARRFLAKLDAVDRQRGRLGPRALRNLRPYRQRDATGLWPTEIFSMDGHTFDAEVAHPFHGQPFRPEITSAIDIATRKLVGWSVALAESSLAVLDALRHAVQTHGIPAELYVDNGSGYHNALMEQQAIGFMARLGITKTHSRPFNSQARGVIERLHQTVWVRLAKTFATYLGDAMDKEARDSVHKITRQDLKKVGKSRLLPTWPEFLARCAAAVADYNAHPHTSLPLIRDPRTGRKRHQSPDEVWAELVQQNPECLVTIRETEVADLFRPYKTGKVTRGMVRIFGNLYFDSALSGHHGEPVFIGYDIHDAERVWVRDRNQALIAVARLDANKSDYRPQTALEHAHATRAKGRLIRLERHLDEVHLELTGSRPVLEGRLATPEEQAAAREYLAESAPAPLGAAGRDEGETGQRPRIFRSDLELWQWVQDHPALANDQDRAYLAECLEDEDFRDLIAREAQKKSRLTSSAA